MVALFNLKKGTFARDFVFQLSILAAVVVAFAIVLIILGKNISQKADLVSDLRREINEINAMGESFSLLVKDYQAINPYLTDLENVLPTKDKLIDFSKEVSDLADSLGMDFSFIFREEEKTTGAPAVKFTLSLKNSALEKLVIFLETLKKSRYFVNFDSFDISGPSLEKIASQRDELSLSMTGKVFIQI